STGVAHHRAVDLHDYQHLSCDYHLHDDAADHHHADRADDDYQYTARYHEHVAAELHDNVDAPSRLSSTGPGDLRSRPVPRAETPPKGRDAGAQYPARNRCGPPTQPEEGQQAEPCPREMRVPGPLARNPPDTARRHDRRRRRPFITSAPTMKLSDHPIVPRSVA